MGAPVSFAGTAQVGAGIGGFLGTIAALKDFSFTEKYAAGMIALRADRRRRHDHTVELAAEPDRTQGRPALAAGNTMVLKPSEECPGNAVIFAEILEAAGVPAGVFNLVQGDGPTVGNAISAHPGIEMVSFTGSTRAGILVAKAAADTVKRVHQELGGKSPNIVLPDADFAAVLPPTVQGVLVNTGQSCIAPTRILVQKDREAEAVGVIKAMFDGTSGRRSAGRGRPYRPRRQQGAVRQDPGPDPVGDRRRRDARDRRHRPARRTSTAATTSSRRSSRASRATCASPTRKSSGPSRRSWPMATSMKPSISPTTPNMACRP